MRATARSGSSQVCSSPSSSRLGSMAEATTTTSWAMASSTTSDAPSDADQWRSTAAPASRSRTSGRGSQPVTGTPLGADRSGQGRGAVPYLRHRDFRRQRAEDRRRFRRSTLANDAAHRDHSGLGASTHRPGVRRRARGTPLGTTTIRVPARGDAFQQRRLGPAPPPRPGRHVGRRRLRGVGRRRGPGHRRRAPGAIRAGCRRSGRRCRRGPVRRRSRRRPSGRWTTSGFHRSTVRCSATAALTWPVIERRSHCSDTSSTSGGSATARSAAVSGRRPHTKATWWPSATRSSQS